MRWPIARGRMTTMARKVFRTRAGYSASYWLRKQRWGCGRSGPSHDLVEFPASLPGIGRACRNCRLASHSEPLRQCQAHHPNRFLSCDVGFASRPAGRAVRAAAGRRDNRPSDPRRIGQAAVVASPGLGADRFCPKSISSLSRSRGRRAFCRTSSSASSTPECCCRSWPSSLPCPSER